MGEEPEQLEKPRAWGDEEQELVMGEKRGRGAAAPQGGAGWGRAAESLQSLEATAPTGLHQTEPHLHGGATAGPRRLIVK